MLSRLVVEKSSMLLKNAVKTENVVEKMLSKNNKLFRMLSRKLLKKLLETKMLSRKLLDALAPKHWEACVRTFEMLLPLQDRQIG